MGELATFHVNIVEECIAPIENHLSGNDIWDSITGGMHPDAIEKFAELLEIDFDQESLEEKIKIIKEFVTSDENDCRLVDYKGDLIDVFSPFSHHSLDFLGGLILKQGDNTLVCHFDVSFSVTKLWRRVSVDQKSVKDGRLTVLSAFNEAYRDYESQYKILKGRARGKRMKNYIEKKMKEDLAKRDMKQFFDEETGDFLDDKYTILRLEPRELIPQRRERLQTMFRSENLDLYFQSLMRFTREKWQRFESEVKSDKVLQSSLKLLKNNAVQYALPGFYKFLYNNHFAKLVSGFYKTRKESIIEEKKVDNAIDIMFDFFDFVRVGFIEFMKKESPAVRLGSYDKSFMNYLFAKFFNFTTKDQCRWFYRYVTQKYQVVENIVMDEAESGTYLVIEKDAGGLEDALLSKAINVPEYKEAVSKDFVSHMEINPFCYLKMIVYVHKNDNALENAEDEFSLGDEVDLIPKRLREKYLSDNRFRNVVEIPLSNTLIRRKVEDEKIRKSLINYGTNSSFLFDMKDTFQIVKTPSNMNNSSLGRLSCNVVVQTLSDMGQRNSFHDCAIYEQDFQYNRVDEMAFFNGNSEKVFEEYMNGETNLLNMKESNTLSSVNNKSKTLLFSSCLKSSDIFSPTLRYMIPNDEKKDKMKIVARKEIDLVLTRPLVFYSYSIGIYHKEKVSIVQSDYESKDLRIPVIKHFSNRQISEVFQLPHAIPYLKVYYVFRSTVQRDRRKQWFESLGSTPNFYIDVNGNFCITRPRLSNSGIYLVVDTREINSMNGSSSQERLGNLFMLLNVEVSVTHAIHHPNSEFYENVDSAHVTKKRTIANLYELQQPDYTGLEHFSLYVPRPKIIDSESVDRQLKKMRYSNEEINRSNIMPPYSTYEVPTELKMNISSGYSATRPTLVNLKTSEWIAPVAYGKVVVAQQKFHQEKKIEFIKKMLIEAYDSTNKKEMKFGSRNRLIESKESDVVKLGFVELPDTYINPDFVSDQSLYDSLLCYLKQTQQVGSSSIPKSFLFSQSIYNINGLEVDGYQMKEPAYTKDAIDTMMKELSEWYCFSYDSERNVFSGHSSKTDMTSYDAFQGISSQKNIDSAQFASYACDLGRKAEDLNWSVFGKSVVLVNGKSNNINAMGSNVSVINCTKEKLLVLLKQFRGSEYRSKSLSLHFRLSTINDEKSKDMILEYLQKKIHVKYNESYYRELVSVVKDNNTYELQHDNLFDHWILGSSLYSPTHCSAQCVKKVQLIHELKKRLMSMFEEKIETDKLAEFDLVCSIVWSVLQRQNEINELIGMEEKIVDKSMVLPLSLLLCTVFSNKF